MLAHQNVAHLLPPGTLPDVVLGDRGRLEAPADERRALRLRDLVQITGLPRETVRRKLGTLASEQWATRTPQGWLAIAVRLEPSVREVTRASARRFLAAADEILRIVREADAELAARATPFDGRPAVQSPGPSIKRLTRSQAGAPARRLSPRKNRPRTKA